MSSIHEHDGTHILKEHEEYKGESMNDKETYENMSTADPESKPDRGEGEQKRNRSYRAVGTLRKDNPIQTKSYRDLPTR